MRLKRLWRTVIVGLISAGMIGCSSGTSGPVEEKVEGGFRIEDGMAQPMLTFSDESTPNKDSEVLRFCVYVETDHDTDGDGKADLVKTFIQLPKAAAQGEYKAAAIYDPTPYAAGVVSDTYSLVDSPFGEDSYDKTKMYETGKKRKSKEKIDTLEYAMKADASEYNYTVPKSGDPGYSYSALLDYFLIRGFAIVECSGIGTYGSEGYEVCGTDLERDSHKAVVEWLAGNGKAFTDKENNIEIDADWCNHNVAMMGVSYGGTLPFEVATTGVKGLKTIIPFAGIANWYNYVNSQGVTMNAYPHYTDLLSAMVAGAAFEDDGWYVPNVDYISYLKQVRKDEDKANGNYDETWDAMNYSDDTKKIKCSALLVYGLNDWNVMTLHGKLMYEAFKEANQNVKVLLHQDGHNIFLGKYIDDELSNDLYNKWLCHYLYDVDNGIEDMPEVYVQSNVDGSFYTQDSWNDIEPTSFKPKDQTGEKTITSRDLSPFIADMTMSEDYYYNLEDQYVSVYEIPIPEDAVISGTPELHVKLLTEDTDKDNLMVTAILMDEMKDGSAFKVLQPIPDNNDRLPVKTTDHFDIGEGHDTGKVQEYVKSYTYCHAITYGHIDLLDPDADENPTLDTKYHTAKTGEYNDYTIYFQPTEYTLQKGHVLKLYLLGQDPIRCRIDISKSKSSYFAMDKVDEIYSFTIDHASVEVKCPIRE